MNSKEYIDLMKQKYPDVEICTGEHCELKPEEHEVFYIYEQQMANDAKEGKIRTYYKSDGKGNVEELHMKYNGEKWVDID